MPTFTSTLAAGGKAPYDRWTFIVLPAGVAQALGGRFPLPVRGTLAGTPFRGTAARGEGVCRIPLPRELQDAAGVRTGDTVRITVEPDAEPRPVEVPPELQAVLDADPDLFRRFDALPPSMRRAWAGHVAEAKRPETRAKRAAAAPAGIRARAFPR